MRVFIELPTWLGDSVMASMAIENLRLNYQNIKFTFFGSFVSTELFKNNPNCEKIIVDNSKKSKFRLFYIIKTSIIAGKFDAALSFRNHFYTKVLMFFIKTGRKFIYKKEKNYLHQAVQYLNFVLRSFEIPKRFDGLKLFQKPIKNNFPTLGLNPGATYGNAKRWNPKYFAQVAISLKDRFHIIIFGSNQERAICDEIENIIINQNKQFKMNGESEVVFTNLCSKTSIQELTKQIAALDMFITNDSGPMHIAAAYKIPTIALFGPTNFIQTSPYKNEKAKILHLNLSCMPCMKRICPLNTHECMEKLLPQMVLEEIKNLNLN